MSTFTLYQGDCLDKLKELDDNSIDSIVTDPPYGLAFMGKKWDYDVPSQEIWEECIRVLKPGGHLLSFAGSRTYHRMAVRIEDAGFEIRDQIMWVYGSGFPKSHNIGKGVDKQLGNEREVVGTKKGQGTIPNDRGNWGLKPNTDVIVDKGNSQWEGWGTALKPAHEPIVMARKPFRGTVVDNVLEWGTGGINVDGCRIAVDMNREGDNAKRMNKTYSGSSAIFGQADGDTTFDGYDKGRFPANIIFDEEAGKILDEQSGNKTGQRGVVKGTEPSHSKKNAIYGDYSMVDGKYAEPKDGLGGASRFFYCPKSSKKDRNEGNTTNIHPTVKPTELMTYLIRLVTPPNGIVLDPFMGSGSTGKAAIREGFQFVGIEREEEYMEIAQQRIEWEAKKQNPHNWF
jgi:site-specific DNA-methyltransferase (adenine-specific)